MPLRLDDGDSRNVRTLDVQVWTEAGPSSPWCSAAWCLAKVEALGKNLKQTSHWIRVLSCRVWLANTSGWLVLLWYHSPDSCCGNKSSAFTPGPRRRRRAAALVYLVRPVAEVTAEWLASYVRALVFVQQGGAGEHLVAGGAPVELLGVELLHVPPMLLQGGETQTALLAVVRLRQI